MCLVQRLKIVTYFSRILTDRVNTGGNAIASLPPSDRPSVRPSARVSIRPFPLHLSNQLPFDLDLLHVYGSLPGLTGIEIEGHRSRSRVKVGYCLLFACSYYLPLLGSLSHTVSVRVL